jgi:hypothetical protein
MVTVFWDSEGVILLDVMQRGTKINTKKIEEAFAVYSA